MPTFKATCKRNRIGTIKMHEEPVIYIPKDHELKGRLDCVHCGGPVLLVKHHEPAKVIFCFFGDYKPTPDFKGETNVST